MKKKEAQKQKSWGEITIFIIISVAALVGVSFLSEEKIFPVQEEALTLIVKEESYIAKQKNVPDFPSSKEGVFVGVIQQNPLPVSEGATVLLFRSVRVPKLVIAYNPAEQKIIAGTPVMVAEGINLFDGNVHKITYFFEKDGKQQLLVDGRMVAEKYFELEGNFLTGLVTGAGKGMVSELWKEVTFLRNINSKKLS